MLKIRNPKHEIPGPDPAATDPMLKSGIRALIECIGEPRMSRQGGPKQYPMAKIRMTKTQSHWPSVLNIGVFVL
jgi:hypothetical protein